MSAKALRTDRPDGGVAPRYVTAGRIAVPGAPSHLTSRRQHLHPRVPHPDQQRSAAGRLRDGVEPPHDQHAAAVGLDDLDLEAFAGADPVRRAVRHGAERASPGVRCVFTLTSSTEPARTVGPARHDDAVTDEQPEPSDVRVFDRLLAAGLPLERIEQHMTAGRMRVDGELVTDPYAPAPPGTRVTLWAE